MRFPIAASALLILRSRANAVNAFSSLSSPLVSFPLSGLGLGLGSGRQGLGGSFNSNKNVKRTGLAFIHRGGGGSAASKATVSADNNEISSSSRDDDGNSNSNNNNNNKDDDDNDNGLGDIAKAAQSSRAITGTSLQISKFGNVPYVDTRMLTAKHQHRVLFVLGGPGAGKGTQSERIVNTYKCIHLSVGELLRNERKRGDESPHAELIESCLVAGQIVPVEISLNLVRNAMDEACNSNSQTQQQQQHGYGQPIFLVDGFPRNFDNLSGWTENMPEYAAAIGSLVYDCPIEILEQRIMARAETSGRSDDNLESARKRFHTFQSQTMPVVYALEEVERMQMEESQSLNDGYGNGNGNGFNGLSKINIQHIVGDGSIEEVWDATKAAMDKYVTNDVLTANSLLMEAIETKNFEQYSQLCSDKMLQSSTKANDNDDDTVTTSTDVDSPVVSSEEMFHKYELVGGGEAEAGSLSSSSHISNVTVTVQDGTKAIVNYDRRIMDDNGGQIIAEFKESRIWSHEEKGWVCVHFVRKPLSE